MLAFGKPAPESVGSVRAETDVTYLTCDARLKLVRLTRPKRRYRKRICVTTTISLRGDLNTDPVAKILMAACALSTPANNSPFSVIRIPLFVIPESASSAVFAALATGEVKICVTKSLRVNV
jgi:translation initiation factor 1 (eIF-1/SUI1)